MALEDAKTEVDSAFTRKARRGLSFENTFGGAPSFLRRSYTKDLTGVDLAVTGIPFDQAVTNRPGTRLGPRAIREASALQSPDPPYGWGFDPLSEFDIVDTAISPSTTPSPRRFRRRWRRMSRVSWRPAPEASRWGAIIRLRSRF
jgi:hypothetical protein